MTSPLGMQGAAVALPALPDEKQDDSASAGTSTSHASASIDGGGGASSAPSAPRHQHRGDVNDDRGKEEVRRRRSKSKSKLKSIFGFFRRTSSDVVSYLTIMTTWLVFRFLLTGLNKVNGWCLMLVVVVPAVMVLFGVVNVQTAVDTTGRSSAAG